MLPVPVVLLQFGELAPHPLRRRGWGVHQRVHVVGFVGELGQLGVDVGAHFAHAGFQSVWVGVGDHNASLTILARATSTAGQAGPNTNGSARSQSTRSPHQGARGRARGTRMREPSSTTIALRP